MSPWISVAWCSATGYIASSKYPYQGQIARALGADDVVDASADDLVDRIGALAGSRVLKVPSGGAILTDGAPLIHDTVTNPASMDLALRTVRPGGKIVLLGIPSALNDLDWSVAVVREVQLAGSLMYGNEVFDGGRKSTFARALDFLRSRRVDLRAIQPRTYPGAWLTPELRPPRHSTWLITIDRRASACENATGSADVHLGGCFASASSFGSVPQPGVSGRCRWLSLMSGTTVKSS